MSTDRLVIVDDTDPGITYTGSWTVDHGTEDSGPPGTFGDNGPEYNQTLHGATVNGSIASYVFNGTFIQVLGTIDTIDKGPPLWSCSVDDSPIDAFPASASPGHINYYRLCQGTALLPGEHTLTIKPSFNSSGSVFWIDTLQYVPVQDDGLDSVVLQVQNIDDDVEFNGTWNKKAIGNIAAQTSTAGSTCQFIFNGTSVSLWGINAPGTPNTAAYSVDGGESTTFTLVPSDIPNNQLNFNQLLFTSPPLSVGQHNVTITFTGDTTGIPLAIDYFQVVTNPLSSSSTPTSFPTTTSTTPTTTHSPSGTAPPSSTVNTGAIVGGIVGALSVILLALLAFWFYLRRRSRKRRAQLFIDTNVTQIQQMESAARIQPFLASNTSPTSGPSSPPRSGGFGSVSSKGRSNASSPGVARRTTHSYSTRSSSLRSPSGSSAAGPTIVRHQDSGVRMAPEHVQGQIIDVPPDYSAS